MKLSLLLFAAIYILTTACSPQTDSGRLDEKAEPMAKEAQKAITTEPKKSDFSLKDIKIEKQLLYDSHTLDDVYPYKKTTRKFQWDKIKERLFYLDSVQIKPASWGVLQNYKNLNREAPLVKKWKRDAYTLVADTLGVERYQSVPLYAVTDTITPELYGRDGSLVKLLGAKGNYMHVQGVSFQGEWLIPKRYIKQLGDTVHFTKVICVDRSNQNIMTLDKDHSVWYVRSMNPATTGLHRPPYQHETPKGLFVIQERKAKMIFLKDGSTDTGGFSPWASRFCNGGYLHGVPVNAPRTALIEFSPSLGTTPRSHMCVRNATSHAKFIYEWESVLKTIVFVFD